MTSNLYIYKPKNQSPTPIDYILDKIRDKFEEKKVGNMVQVEAFSVLAEIFSHPFVENNINVFKMFVLEAGRMNMEHYRLSVRMLHNRRAYVINLAHDRGGRMHLQSFIPSKNVLDRVVSPDYAVIIAKFAEMINSFEYFSGPGRNDKRNDQYISGVIRI